MADSGDFGSLTIVCADGTRSELRLSGPILTIGRDPGNALVLPEASVSRFHGRLEWRDGLAWIIDHQSTCGTWLHQAQVREHPLADGDCLVIGESQVTWHGPRPVGSGGRCYACSSPLAPGSAFCDSCGARADIASTPPPVPSPPPRRPEPAPPGSSWPPAAASPPPQPAGPAQPAATPFLPPAVPHFPGPAPAPPPVSQMPASPPLPVVGAPPPPAQPVATPGRQEVRVGAPPGKMAGKPFEPPQAIGQVLQTFTFPPGQGEATFDSTTWMSLLLGPVGCGLVPIVLMSFGVGMMLLDNVYRFYHLDMVAWFVPLGALLVLAVLKFISSRTVAWIGEHGAAAWHKYPLTAPTCDVLVFAQAVDLVKQQIHTTFTRNGAETGYRIDVHLRWMDGAGRELLHLYTQPGLTPWGSEKHRFAEAVEKAWMEHLLPLAEQALARDGSLDFPVYKLVGLTVRSERTNQVLKVRHGMLELCVEGRSEQTFQGARMENGQLQLTDPQGKKWQKPVYAIPNLSLFIMVSEQVAGVRWQS